MTTSFIVIGLFIFGAALGSFAAAQVWRLRARQLVADELHGEKVKKRETAQVQVLLDRPHRMTADRSMCLHCGKTLSWYELLPVVSWLMARGKCRTCHKPIGKMELLAELGLGLLVALSYVAWPYGYDTHGVVLFILWVIILTLLAIHWMYDAKWFLLIDRITLALLGVALLFLAFRATLVAAPEMGSFLLATGLTLLVLPGFYGLLYVVSKGRWVGFGDVKLLVPFALVLPAWEYGVLVLFLANLIGCVVLLPSMLAKKLTRMTRVPFGPFLISAFVIAVLFGRQILGFYLGMILF